MKRKSFGHRCPRSTRCTAALGMLLAALLASAAPAGAVGAGSFSLGYSASNVYGDWWSSGPEAAALLALWKRAGIYLGGGLHSNMNKGVNDNEGWMADVGLWKSFGSDGIRSIILGGLSVSMGSPYEFDLGGFGFHVGFRQEIWFGQNVGLYGRAMVRVWLAQSGDMKSACPGLGGGLCFRF